VSDFVSRSSWPEFAALIVSLARPSIGLTVVAAAQVLPDGHVNTSSYGGLPPLPAEVDWPLYGTEPMVLLAQLDCVALAAVAGAEWTLPATGTLLFFHDEAFAAPVPRDGVGDDGCRALHVPAGAPVRPAPPGTPTIPALPLAAEPVLSMPSMGAPQLYQRFRDNPPDALDVFNEAKELVERPRHRVLGWSDDDFFDAPGFRPVLQLEAEAGTAWGECVNVSFWAPEEDLAAGRLDRVRRVLEVA
jgi:hypothetical protein